MVFTENLPEKILSWRLKGPGLENFGSGKRPELLPFPPYGEENLVARVDACGLCFSDIKLITSGASHPRIAGRDLSADPVIPGHEVSLTLVGVGDAWKDRIAPGSRYILQADVFYRGKGMAFGYVLPGGLSQYVVIGREVIEGDDGCYLLPVRKETGHVEAALVEPWTCVIASSQISARTEPAKDAVLFFFGSGNGQIPLDLAGIEAGKISRVFFQGLSPENEEAVIRFGRDAGRGAESGPPPSDGPRPTDIVCAGVPRREDFAALVAALETGGMLGIHAAAVQGSLPVDVGKVHYQRIELVGSEDGGVLASYRHNTRERLAPGGSTLFAGGAGPMGQMHVIKAVLDPDGPARILVTDHLDERLRSLEQLVSLLVKRRGRAVSLSFVNSKDLDGDELESRLARDFPGGFDDIVVLVPLAAAISEVSSYLAPRGVLNVFAGVKPGTVADLPLEAIVKKRARIMGSSGSPLSAMRSTLAMLESGRLSTALSLAAVGDMASASRGMKALIDGTYTGKIVIFPFAHGLGIRSMRELAKELPEIAPLLLDGQYWTNEAEAAFMKSRFFAPA
jgi:threonine dehydrogenase-like Zn-dependent dehydrogenase